MKNSALLLFWGRTGGGALYSQQMAKALYEEGIYFYGSLSKQNELYEMTKVNFVNSYNISTYNNNISFIISSTLLPFKLFGLFKFIKKNKIDTIYIPMRQHWTFLVIYFAKKLNIKTILTCHDPALHLGEESKILNKVLTWEIRHSNQIITLTECVKNSLVTLSNIESEIISVIPHAAFKFSKEPNSSQIAFKERNLLFFGRILDYKGLDLFLLALKELQNRGKEYKASIYGNGDIQKYIDLTKSVDNLVIENRWIADDEIDIIFSSHGALILPYKEASQSGPITIAFDYAMPVITTPLEGLKEQIGFGERGVISKSLKPVDIANAIELLFSSNESFETYSNNAIQHVHNELSWSSSARKLIGIINK